MGLAFIPIYIHFLGMEAFGLIGLFAIMQAWLTLLDFGMTPTISREMAKYTAGSHTRESIKDLLRSLETISVSVGILIVLLIWIASGWLATNWLKVEKLPVEQVSSAIAVIGLVVALRFLEGLYRSAIIGLQRQVWLNCILSLAATLRWGGAAAVVWMLPDVNAYFYWHAFISVATIFAFLIAIHCWLPNLNRPPKFSFSAIKQIWPFAKGMLLTTLLALLLTQIDKILLSKLIDLEAFGYYTLAATIVAVLYQVAIPISQAYYPRMTEQVVRGELSQLAATYHQASQLVTVFVVTIAFVAIAFSYDLLMMWTGDQEVSVNTAPIISILALGTMLNALLYIPNMLLLANGWTDLAVKVNAVAVIILAPSIYLVTPQHGAIGAAWCWVLLNVGYISVAMHFLYKRTLSQEKRQWYFHDLGLPSLAIGGVVVLSYLLYPDFHSDIQKIVWILLTSGLGFCVGVMFAKQIPAKYLINKIIGSIR